MKDIVLIHGWACDESIWQETKDYLKQKYRLFTINLPEMENMDSYRDAVLELIKQKSLTEVVLIGWSMGSLVALQVASYLKQEVQGLVLVSGTSKFQAEKYPVESLPEILSEPSEELYPGGIPSALVTRMKKRLGKDQEQTINDFYKLMFSSKEQVQGLDDQIMDNYLRRGRKWDLLEAQSGLDFLMEADLRTVLPAIACSSLLLHGEEDTICPLVGANHIERLIPRAQKICFPGTGHIPFLTEFENFHQALEEWLAVL